MALRGCIVAMITLDIFLGRAKRQRHNLQFSGNRIPPPVHITKTRPYIWAAAYYKAFNLMCDGNTQTSMFVIQYGSVCQCSRSQCHRVQGQHWAMQHDRVVQRIIFWPRRSKMEHSHASGQSPLQPVHNGIKLRIGIDLGITIPDALNVVLEDVIDH